MRIIAGEVPPVERQHTGDPSGWPWSRLPFWPFRCRARSTWGHRCELKPTHMIDPDAYHHLVSRGMDEYEFVRPGGGPV